jgi:hypothetical protein
MAGATPQVIRGWFVEQWIAGQLETGRLVFLGAAVMIGSAGDGHPGTSTHFSHHPRLSLEHEQIVLKICGWLVLN